MNKKTLSLFIFALFSSSLASATIFINHPLDSYEEYKVIKKHAVMSIMDSQNNLFTYAGTYILSKQNALGLKKEISLEVRCTRFENIEPSYNFKDIVVSPVNTRDECSKLIMTINNLLDDGLNPKVLLNSSNGKFLVFRE